MATTQRKKYGNLDVVRGGQYGSPRRPRGKTPEDILFDREVREVFASMRGSDGRVPGRAFYDIACDAQHPLRILARRIREARAQQVPLAQVKELVRRIDRYVDRLYGCMSGEFDTAA